MVAWRRAPNGGAIVSTTAALAALSALSVPDDEPLPPLDDLLDSRVECEEAEVIGPVVLVEIVQAPE